MSKNWCEITAVVMATLFGCATLNAQAPVAPERPAVPGFVDLTPPELQSREGGEPRSEEAAQGRFSVAIDYLLAFPRRSGQDYAIADATNNRTPQGTIRSMDWGVSNGIRASVGWSAPNRRVNASMGYTYILGEDLDRSSAPPGGFLYATQTRPGLVDLASTAVGVSKLNYNVYDLDVGRTVVHEPYFTVRWSGGVRIAAIFQNMNVVYDGRQADRTRVFSRNTYVAGGVTTAAEGRWTLPNNFSLFARGGGALMSGAANSRLLETDHGGATINADLSERLWRITPVAEIALGLVWQRYGYSLSVGYELTHWFGLTAQPQLIDDLADGKFTRRISDLGIEAIVFRLTKTF